MVRSTAIEIIARRLSLNAGRVAALAQRAAEAGELPKAVGRNVPDLAPIGLAKLLLCAIADRGLGNAAASVREFAALRSDGGATLIDLLEGWMSGKVQVSGVHSLIVQLEPAAMSIITDSDRLHYGAPREHDIAARVVTIPGDALRAIVSEHVKTLLSWIRYQSARPPRLSTKQPRPLAPLLMHSRKLQRQQEARLKRRNKWGFRND